jgi:hypothetical protein
VPNPNLENNVKRIWQQIYIKSKRPFLSTKMFHKFNKTWAQYEHNKCGLSSINLISPPQQSMGNFCDKIQECMHQCQNYIILTYPFLFNFQPCLVEKCIDWVWLINPNAITCVLQVC